MGTGGETLDTVVTSDTTAASPNGDPNFNANNLESATGNFWGVMALTLGEHGYQWDYESALPGPTTLANGPTLPAPTATGAYIDKGVGTCHGPNRW